MFRPSWSTHVKVYLTLRAHWDDHNKTYISGVCLLSASNNQPLCHLIWQLRSLSLSTACSSLCWSTWVKMEFLGARFTSWFTLQQQPADAFMIKAAKLEPEESKAGGRPAEREKAAKRWSLLPATFSTIYTQSPESLVLKKMNVVIVIVMIITVNRAHGMRKLDSMSVVMIIKADRHNVGSKNVSSNFSAIIVLIYMQLWILHVNNKGKPKAGKGERVLMFSVSVMP